MVSLPGIPSPSPAEPGDAAIRFERVGQALQTEALSMLLTGQRDAGDAAVRPFLTFARDNRLDLHNLWVVWDGKRLAAATLMVPGVGRTAMLFLSPVASVGRVELSGRLVAHVVSRLDPAEVTLVQALLEQGQSLQQRALEAGNFKFLAELAYMHRAGKSRPSLPPIALDGQALTPVYWSDASKPLFAEAIAESYVDTLDCPGLLGLREMDDIIAGHMATGRFNPRHWTVWTHADHDKPAALLLLAEANNGVGFELVYIGVSPWARGHGLSKLIMHHALDTTARQGRGDLYLAVDQRNAPALHLYRGLNFRTSAHKTALIYTPARSS